MPETTETIDATQTEAQAAPAPAEADPAAGLKSALTAERKLKADAEKRARAAEAELERLREAAASDAEKALMEARRQGRAEAEAELTPKLTEAEARYRAALKVAEIKAQAAGRFHDLGDVVMALAGDEGIAVNDDGTVTGVEKALEALAKRKPHWVKAEEARPNLSAPGGNGRQVPSAASQQEREQLAARQAQRVRSLF